MKTTLDLPDDLLIEAKAVAARRRTTLKAIIEHALRREIMQLPEPDENGLLVRKENGLLCLRKRGVTVTTEVIRQLMDEEGI